MPALPSCILKPLWDQFHALLPQREATHPLGCHRPRIPDRIVFDKLIQVLVFGCGYRRIDDHTCSASTLRRRRNEWIAAGLADQLHLLVLAAYDHMIGLELADIAVDGCITKAPCGGQVAGRSPVDRGKQGLKRSVATEATGIPLGAIPAPANRHDSPLLAPTLDRALGTLNKLGPLPAQPTVHLDAGYDSDKTRTVLAERDLAGQVAAKGTPAPIQATKRWPVERTHAWATSSASCAGAPSAPRRSWSSGSVWPTRSSRWAGCSGGPGLATAGRPALGAAPDHRRPAQALLLRRPSARCRRRAAVPSSVARAQREGAAMHYGIEVVTLGDYAEPRVVVALAQAAEAAGWDGLFVWDHLGFVWGAPSADPWVILAAVAQATGRLRLGTAVTPLPRRRPQVLASTVATLDRLSQGRVIFGAGLGGVAQEFTAFGEPGDARQRAARLDEGLELLERLWAGQTVTHHGSHYLVEGVTLAPLPVQRPWIPVWIGGTSRPALRRAARWDGWVTGGVDEQGRPTTTPEQIAGQVGYIRQHRAASAAFDVALTGCSEPGDTALVGAFGDAGVTWWLESLHGVRGSVDQLRARVQAGPPKR